MKLIDKDALVAEIEKRRRDWCYGSSIEAKYKREECDDILSFLDTIEVKEVDKEPVSMWHDVSEKPKPNTELICVGQYGNPLVLSSNSNSFKERYISKWAYFNDLLNLSNVYESK
jgi:hypothetical protein